MVGKAGRHCTVERNSSGLLRNTAVFCVVFHGVKLERSGCDSFHGVTFRRPVYRIVHGVLPGCLLWSFMQLTWEVVEVGDGDGSVAERG